MGMPFHLDMGPVENPLRAVSITPGARVDVMDMVIFRTIFFELFSFLHVRAPYPPFRLLMNLGTRQETRRSNCIRAADSNGTKSQTRATVIIGAPSWNQTPPP